MASGTDFGVVFPGQVGSNFLTFIASQNGSLSATMEANDSGFFQISSIQSYRRMHVVSGGGGHNPQIRKPVAPLSAARVQPDNIVWDWVLDEQGSNALPNVSKGEMIEVVVNFYAPTTDSAPNIEVNDVYSATLKINGPLSEQLTYPLTAQRGGFFVAANPAQLTIHQGQQATVALTVTSLCGPYTDVVFQNKSNIPSLGVSITPATVHLLRGASAPAMAEISAGQFGGTLLMPVSAFEGGLTLYWEEAVTVLEGSQSVQVWSDLPPKLTLVQGASSSFTIIVAVKDLETEVVVSANLFPEGVIVTPATAWDAAVPDVGSASIGFSIAADPKANVGDAGAVTLNWSVYNGQVTGSISTEMVIQPAYPPQLDFDFNPITLPDGTPVGGFAHLTLRQDGSYTFSGHFHDSGATQYDMSMVVGVKDSVNHAYGFPHTGHVSGTFESGSRDDDWNDNSTYPLWTWAALAAGPTVQAETRADADLSSLRDSVIGLLGLIVGVAAWVFPRSTDPPAGNSPVD